MHSGFMSLRAFRILHARAVTANAKSNQVRNKRLYSDAALISACRKFDRLEQRKTRLLKARDEEDDLAFEFALGKLCIEQGKQLRRMCEERARTMLGHRARALAFTSWDAGDLAYRAKVGEATEDLILLAIIRDLIGGSNRL